MKRMLPVILSAVICGGFIALEAAAASAQESDLQQSDVAALKAEIEALRRVVPSQSHAMMDVEYHFANLWFAAQNTNWALAAFYLNETRSHINWTVRIRPVRKLSTGQDFDLRPMLEGIEHSSLAQLKSAIDRKDRKAFDTAYRQTMNECYACHKLAEKPYLRPHIPAAPATRMIDMKPLAN
jgi:DNA-binding GntR family transcriptional regulator